MNREPSCEAVSSVICPTWTNTTVASKCLSSQERRQCATLFVVMIGGELWMPPTPPGPRDALVGGLLHGQDQPPQEPTPLGDAQREERPRLALNAVRGLPSGGGGRLWAGRVREPARRGLADWHSPETPQVDHAQCSRLARCRGAPPRPRDGLVSESRCVNDQHGRWGLQVLHPLVAPCLTRRLGDPQRPALPVLQDLVILG
jgi:hypothetical protein